VTRGYREELQQEITVELARHAAERQAARAEGHQIALSVAKSMRRIAASNLAEARAAEEARHREAPGTG
jgi:crotonobetainyl-CoA:carnitine CoA-transferase CaiB-like acyl-CoA transferase